MKVSLKLTPGMKQFRDVKSEYPDCILFFRMGDFYEMFFEDAKIVSRILGITLTKRGGAPLAGVPHYTGEDNINKVVKAGYKVAVCEQLEDPKTVKNRIVKRGVVRIVTPGTITAMNFLDSKSNNFIISIIPHSGLFGFGIADISTGAFKVSVLNSKQKVEQELARFNPSEVLIPSDFELEFRKLDEFVYSTKLEEHHYTFHSAYKRLTQHFKVLNLEGFGIDNNDCAVQAGGALLTYLYETQKSAVSQITSLSIYNPEKYMVLDRSTLRNLELFKNIRDNTERSSLLSVIDQTVTSMGGRLLREWLSHPLIQIEIINQRLESVEELTNQTLVREEIKKLLDNVYDIERLITRVSTRNANAKDLLALKESLTQIPSIKAQLSNMKTSILSNIKNTQQLDGVVDLISKSIKENPPARLTEGNIIKESYSRELDELRNIMKNGKKFLAEIETQEQEKTGIPLKIKYNKIHGYYIEITNRHSNKVPSHYVRKQTLVNAERYITPELKEKEELILGAEEKIQILEQELFRKVLEDVAIYLIELQEIALNLAVLDVLISFSSVAVNNNYCKPELHNGYESLIDDGRHPVVENIHPEPYVPNHTLLTEEQRLLIITGPNMAGKSSYMRQVALIHLLAQIGSFVPCTSARLALVDRIFTRVGAHDDLTMGQSTFMVEMTETANILNNLSNRSLVIMDEIGRGTSTFDGVSLAWAVAEHLYKSGAKTLFATHYHQLNNLSSDFEGVKNYNIAVKERGDDIIFLRKLVEGGTDKSYGIQVAKLAGVPNGVLERARRIQSMLETEDEIGDRLRKPLKKDKEVPIILEDIRIEVPKEIKKKDYSLNSFM
jgi:DNA mismatch repair protein MutS